jgi:hypothetical protein
MFSLTQQASDVSHSRKKKKKKKKKKKEKKKEKSITSNFTLSQTRTWKVFLLAFFLVFPSEKIFSEEKKSSFLQKDNFLSALDKKERKVIM